MSLLKRRERKRRERRERSVRKRKRAPRWRELDGSREPEEGCVEVKKLRRAGVVWRDVAPRRRERSCCDPMRAARAAITRGVFECWEGERWRQSGCRSRCVVSSMPVEPP